MSLDLPTHWVVALEPEGAPIRQRYGLTETLHGGPFVAYHRPDMRHWLVVSGMGAALSAGATAFLAERSDAPPWAIWLNVGIAGHGDAEIGSVYLAHTVVDRAAQTTTYATLAMESPLPGAALHTVPRPEGTYPAPVLYDMEGAGFYAVARRLVSSELVQSVKVVSDNPQTPVERFSSAKISHWIEAGLDQIDRVHQALVPLARLERERRVMPAFHDALASRFHLTANHASQLDEIVIRLRALKVPEEAITSAADEAGDARTLIRGLSRLADTAAPHWAQR